MKPAAILLEQATTFAADRWHAAGRFATTFTEFAMSAPSSVWALCAFTAAASIMVTLVTFYLWPKAEHKAAPGPARDSSATNGVWRLASRGLGAQDIARQTGMSHDAVATILRARTASRSVPAVQPGKKRPTAA